MLNGRQEGETDRGYREARKEERRWWDLLYIWGALHRLLPCSRSLVNFLIILLLLLITVITPHLIEAMESEVLVRSKGGASHLHNKKRSKRTEVIKMVDEHHCITEDEAVLDVESQSSNSRFKEDKSVLMSTEQFVNFHSVQQIISIGMQNDSSEDSDL